MVSEQHNASTIPPGTTVFGHNGSRLGTVREAYRHYLLVDRQDVHEDLTIPSHSILSVEPGAVYVSINRDSASEVDHEETVHHMLYDDKPAEE